MDTELVVSTAVPSSSGPGRLDIKTRTWTNNEIRGFCGRVTLFFLSADGQIYWPPIAEPPDKYVRKYCVDPKSFAAVGAATNDRTELWALPVSPEDLRKLHGVSIVHTETTKQAIENWKNDLAIAKVVAEIAETGIQVYKDATK